jgi:uncharacterized protein YjbI with pentapeptide repeats
MRNTIILSFFILVQALIACKPTDEATIVIPESIKKDTVITVVDTEFENLMLFYKLDNDKVINGKIQVSSAILDSTKEINSSPEGYISSTNLRSIDDFKLFKNLQSLYLSKNLFMEDLVVPSLPKLEVFGLDAGKQSNISRVNLGNNKRIRFVAISAQKPLAEINLAGCASLVDIEISIANSSEFVTNSCLLQLPSSNKIRSLHFGGKITISNIEQVNTLHLERFFARFLTNQSLDFSNATNLTEVTLSESDTKEIKLAPAGKLRYIQLQTLPNLKELHFPKLDMISSIRINDVPLAVLDMSLVKDKVYSEGTGSLLNYLVLNKLPLQTFIQPSKESSFHNVDIRDVALERIDLSNFTIVNTVFLSNNNATEVDLSGTINIGKFNSEGSEKLKTVYVHKNQHIDSFPYYPVSIYDQSRTWRKDKWTEWAKK